MCGSYSVWYLGPPEKLSLSATHPHTRAQTKRHSGQQLTQILDGNGRMSTESRRIHRGDDGQSVENLLANRAVRSGFLARVLRKQKAKVKQKAEAKAEELGRHLERQFQNSVKLYTRHKPLYILDE